MTHELRLFFVALQFLTRVPVPRCVGFEPAWLQACLRHFPLVGACIGLWAGAVLWVALLLWPPLVAAVVSLTATVWLTGAFHEDGLADTLDALGGTAGRERALAIMKDSRIGSYGAVALVLALTLKVATVSALASGASTDTLVGGASIHALPADTQAAVLAGLALVWSHAVSRAAPVWVVWRLPYAGDIEQAKAKPLATQVSDQGLGVVLLWVALVSAAALATAGWAGPVVRSAVQVGIGWALPASVLAALCCTRWLRRRLGGFTGDALGATQQIVEAVGLLAWLAGASAMRLPHA